MLPKSISLKDAVFNSSRVAALTAAFCMKDYSILKKAMQDKIHQPYRSKMIPAMNEVLKASVDAGAEGAFLSGSGPTIAAFCLLKNTERVGKYMVKTWRKESVFAKYFVLDFDSKGVQTYPK
jgi:homoserine kinase